MAQVRSASQERTQPMQPEKAKSVLYLLGNDSDKVQFAELTHGIHQVFFSPQSIPAVIDREGQLNIIVVPSVTEHKSSLRAEVHTSPFFGPSSKRGKACHAVWTKQGIFVVNQYNDFFLVNPNSESGFTVEALALPRPLAGLNVAKLAGGADHVVVLTTTGSVYSFGDNTLGQCGSSSNTNLQSYTDVFPTEERQEATLIPSNLFDGPVLDVACGPYHTLFTTNQGTVFSCGSDSFLQLGQFELPKLAPREETGQGIRGGGVIMPKGFRRGPCVVPFAKINNNHVKVFQLAAGAKHSLALGYLSSLAPDDNKTRSKVNPNQHFSATVPLEESQAHSLFNSEGAPHTPGAGTSLLRQIEPRSELQGGSGPSLVTLSWGYGVDGQLGLYRPLHLAPPSKILSIMGTHETQPLHFSFQT